MVTARVKTGSKVMEGLISDGTPEYARDEMSGIGVSALKVVVVVCQSGGGWRRSDHPLPGKKNVEVGGDGTALLYLEGRSSGMGTEPVLSTKDMCETGDGRIADVCPVSPHWSRSEVMGRAGRR